MPDPWMIVNGDIHGLYTREDRGMVAIDRFEYVISFKAWE